MKKKILFVINPISGTRSKNHVAEDIGRYLDKSLYEYAIEYSGYAGHAAEIAASAARGGTDIIAAVGGDGTVNEVARSVVHTDSALAIVPCGSGNGLARHLQIPLSTKKAVEIINTCSIEALDYGKINGYPFFCTCGMGFDAFVSMKFAESKKRGFGTYIDNTVREGIKYEPQTYVIRDENGTEIHKAFLIACANASQYGNNAYIARDASMTDGLMDIIIMEPFNLIEAPQIALQLFNGTLSSNSRIKQFKARKIHITRPTEGAIHCDGDPMMAGKELDIEIIPGALRTVINPDPRPAFGDLAHIHAGMAKFIKYFTEGGSR